MARLARSDSSGQEETSTCQKKMRTTCKRLRIAVSHYANLCTLCTSGLHRVARLGNKKAGARRPRLASWLCARIEDRRRKSRGDRWLRRGALRIATRPPGTGYALRLTHCVAAVLSGPAPAPECSTSASRSAVTDTAKLRPRTDLPSTRALLPAGSVLHRRADPAH